MQMMSRWLHWTRTFSMYWSSLQPETSSLFQADLHYLLSVRKDWIIHPLMKPSMVRVLLKFSFLSCNPRCSLVHAISLLTAGLSPQCFGRIEESVEVFLQFILSLLTLVQNISRRPHRSLYVGTHRLLILICFKIKCLVLYNKFWGVFFSSFMNKTTW